MPPRLSIFLSQPRPFILNLQSLPTKYLFHTSRFLRSDDDGSESYYQTLDLPPNASQAAIKKQFYALSKLHHPDHNPTDSSAPKRFVRISVAYATLGSPNKRAAYDRDLQRSSPNSRSSSMAHPNGSHSSSQSSPYGARPASGLSKRRGTFRGPPPSFYRSGGWGEQGKKRAAAAEEAQGHTASGYRASQSSSEESRTESGYATSGGFSSGQGSVDAGDVPHFDREGHFRRQEVQEERARQRRRMMEERAEYERGGTDMDVLGKMVLVTGVLGLIWGVNLIVGSIGEKRGKEEE